MRKDRMKTKEYSAGSTVLTVAFVLICLVWIMPIYEVVVNSLKSNNAINLDVFALPCPIRRASWALPTMSRV